MPTVSATVHSVAAEVLRLRSLTLHRHPVNIVHDDEATFGERLADRIARGIGSWKFLIIQSLFVVLWFVLNIIAWAFRWDPYPFILLNLMFSIQAAYTGPVLLLAGNRSAQRDRLMAEHDYDTNTRAEKIVETILSELLSNSEATLAIARKLEVQIESQDRSKGTESA